MMAGGLASTWDPVQKSSFITLDSTKLVATWNSGNPSPASINIRSTKAKNSKFYCEVVWHAIGTLTSSSVITCGVCTSGYGITGDHWLGEAGSVSGGFWNDTNYDWAGSAFAYSGTGWSSQADPTVIGIACDPVAGKIWGRTAADSIWNNSASANPVTAAGALLCPAASTLYIAACFYTTGNAPFGQWTLRRRASEFTLGVQPAGFPAFG